MWILTVIPAMVAMVVLALLLLLFRKWKAALVVLALAMALNIASQTFALNPFRGARKGDISVLGYNIHSYGPDFEHRGPAIAGLIEGVAPDFVYLTEYYSSCDQTLDDRLEAEYPYRRRISEQAGGEVFYSRWKIDSLDPVPVDSHPVWVYRVQLSQGSDSVAVYCCHLNTNNYSAERDKIHERGWQLLKYYRNFTDAALRGYGSRAGEADALYWALKDETLPAIVLGDMNDISGSYVIRRIQSAGMKDAWWGRGFGYGATFHDYHMLWRLDHILFEYERLRLRRVETPHSKFSDHDPVAAWFDIR